MGVSLGTHAIPQTETLQNKANGNQAGRKKARWRASGHPKIDAKSSSKASREGPEALLGSLGRFSQEAGGHSHVLLFWASCF